MSNLRHQFVDLGVKFCLISILLIVIQVQGESANDFLPPCSSEIYCHGPILKAVQLCKIFCERKDFVDQGLLNDPQQIIDDFAALNFTDNVCSDPIQREQLEAFVAANFENGTEFHNVTDFPDWVPEPLFLESIADPNFRYWASYLHLTWKNLGRQISEDVDGSDRTSIIYSPNPMIVPGGRFREFYYWDSYWIQRGLLVSNMSDTVRGMIDNFLDNVDKLGYVPNGGRIYYERSQPPLLLPMVDAYYENTQDLAYLRDNFGMMEKEFEFWMSNRTVTFDKGGVSYTMARYAVDRQGPRPEAFEHEYDLINPLPPANQSMIYSNLKSACESGWDFSTRWYKLEEWETGPAGFIHTKTRDIIPVDLNAFLYWNAALLEKYCILLEIIGGCSKYTEKAAELKAGIFEVFWDEEQGSWYDYDWVIGEPRREFYPSNIAPLWVRAEHGPEAVVRVLANMEGSGALDFPGGIPTSMINETGQQWDFPNAWPPLVHMIVEALERSGNEVAELEALRIARDWVDANYIGWKVFDETAMFEKYDVERPGCPGGGGYYKTVLGFGWTNGVILDFFDKYGSLLVAPPVPSELICPHFSVHDHIVTLNKNVEKTIECPEK